MITALVIHIVVLHAQMTVPWIGGTKAAAAPVTTAYVPWILKPGTPVVLKPGVPLVLFK